VNRSPTVGSIPGGGAGHSIITTRNIWKSFGPVEALKDVSFAVRPGEIRGVCGENGAGKSTLIKILTGVYRADRGTVLVDGEATDIRRPQQAQELGIALVAQELSLTLHQTIEDNIWLGNRTVPLFHRRRVFRDRAVRALETVGLGSLDLDMPVAALSIAEDERLARRRIAGDHLTRVEAGASRETNAPDSLEIVVQRLQALAHLARRAHGAKRIVLVHDGCAEHRHDRIA